MFGETLGVPSGGITVNTSNPRIGLDTQIYGSSADADVVVPNAVTITSMTLHIVATLSGAQTATFTLRKNGSDTAIAVTFGVGETTKTVTGSVSFADGDKLYVNTTFSGATAVFVNSVSIGYQVP